VNKLGRPVYTVFLKIHLNRKGRTMQTGTKYQKIVPLKVDIVEKLEEIPVLNYIDIIPPEHRSKHPVVNKGVAAVILTALGYLTRWELTKVAEWVNNQNPHLLFEIMRISRRIGV
jgi:hypothetical protein